MALLIIGLLVFLAPHLLPAVMPRRSQLLRQQLGDGLYRVVYSLLSLLGLVLIIKGYASTRIDAIFLWNPPAFLNPIAALMMLLAMVLLVATYFPGNRIKARTAHPMLLAIKLWAFSHLLVNGRLGDVLLFASFLAWAVFLFIKSKRRDRQQGITHALASPSMTKDLVTLVLGVLLWLLMVAWLHLKLIGVAPFGS